VRRGGFWAKHMGLILGAIGSTLGEHIENLGNNFGNMVGTHQQLMKRKTSSPFPLAPKTQIKKLGGLSGCCTFPLAACNFNISKTVSYLFGLG